MATRSGLVKKTALAEYSRPKAGGIIGITLDEGDTLIDVALTQAGRRGRAVPRKQGMAIRFAEADARAMGRNTRGVKGINLIGGRRGRRHGRRRPGGLPADGLRERLRQADAVRRRTSPARPRPTEDDSRGSRQPRTPSRPRQRRRRRGRRTARRCATASSAAAARACATSAPATATARSSASLAVRDGDDIMLITTQGMVNRTHVGEIRVDRPQHPGRARHEPERRRQDRLDRQGGAGGGNGDGGAPRQPLRPRRRHSRTALLRLVRKPGIKVESPMTQDNFNRLVRALVDRARFAPFAIELVGGTRIEVNHPEAITPYDNGIWTFQSTSDVRTYFESGAVVRLINATGTS